MISADGMRCPYCGKEETGVIDSREVMDGEGIRRRRECKFCKRRFTTYEKAEEADITIIKKDNTREPFDRAKLLGGIMKACEKRRVTREQMEAIVSKIEMNLRSRGVKEIKSRDVGNIVVKELFKLDPVAYIRFASVYNNFDSPEEFRRILGMFRKGSKK